MQNGFLGGRVLGSAPLLLPLLVAAPLSLLAQPPAGGLRNIEEGQPPVVIHATVEGEGHERSSGAASTGSNLYYHGGSGGTGVETSPKLYLVFWGSQWNNNDPSGEANLLEAFYSGVGGSSWLNSVIQYCQGVAAGTVFCSGAGTPAGNPSTLFAGFWYDNGSSAPTLTVWAPTPASP